MGIIFLLQNLGAYVFNNWWARFILIPAIGSFGAGRRAYQSAGRRLNAAARSSFLGGLFLTLLTCIFLFGLNMSIVGPALIILVGVGILVNGFLPKSVRGWFGCFFVATSSPQKNTLGSF